MVQRFQTQLEREAFFKKARRRKTKSVRRKTISARKKRKTIKAKRRKRSILSRGIQILKGKAERTQIIGPIQTKVPIGVKVAAGFSVVPGVGGFVGRALRFAAPKTLKQAIGFSLAAPTLVGVLSLPEGRKFIGRIFDPVRRFATGQQIVGIVKDPSSVLPSGVSPITGTQETFLTKLKDILKKGGPLAAATALGVGLIPATKLAISKLRAPSIPSAVLPKALLPSLPSLTPRTEPLGAVEKTVTTQPEEIVTTPLPSIKITNKPEINISFRKSRKLINQQVLIK